MWRYGAGAPAMDALFLWLLLLLCCYRRVSCPCTDVFYACSSVHMAGTLFTNTIHAHLYTTHDLNHPDITHIRRRTTHAFSATPKPPTRSLDSSVPTTTRPLFYTFYTFISDIILRKSFSEPYVSKSSGCRRCGMMFCGRASANGTGSSSGITEWCVIKARSDENSLVKPCGRDGWRSGKCFLCGVAVRVSHSGGF